MRQWLKKLFGDGRTAKPSELPPSPPVSPGNSRPRVLAAEQQPPLNRPLVFEPALRQYDACRAGEPQFRDAQREQAWYAARNEVLLHITRTIARSSLREKLMLRGSMLLAAWFPEVARRRGDLDWVVLPRSVTMESERGRQLLDSCSRLLRGTVGDRIMIRDTPFVQDEIWTYETSPGVRLIVPWDHQGGLEGTVQLDFVLGEDLPVEPEVLEFAKLEVAGDGQKQREERSHALTGDAEPDSLLAASRQLSLAWKLVWLTTDRYPQGKDLYDAVLLAEAAPVDIELTLATFPPDMRLTHVDLNEREVMDWDVHWADFQKEYPRIGGDVDHWKTRFLAAIDPLCSWLSRSATESTGDSAR